MILPVKYPLITSYPHHANLLSILSNYPDYLPWFCSNYIQLKINIDESFPAELDFYTPFWTDTCPWIKYEYISRELLDSLETNYDNFFQEMINNRYYIYTVVDYYYVPTHRAYQKVHFLHPIFIYGLSVETDSFYCADFYDNSKYMYKEFRTKDIITGFVRNNDKPYNKEQNPGDFIRGIKLMKYNRKCNYRFDLENIIDLLRDYLNSERTSKRYRNEINDPSRLGFGINTIYDRLNFDIKRLLNDADYNIDYRSFSVLRDHKIALELIANHIKDVQKLQVEAQVIKELQKLVKKSTIIRNLMIKYRVTNNKSCLMSLLEKLEFLKNNETEALNMFYISLKNG